MPPDERRQAMFDRDTAQVLACDLFLIILDGRVPDEGACFELGLAYAHKRLRQVPKHLIGLLTDVRAAFLGAKLNPMLALDRVLPDEDALLTALLDLTSVETNGALA
jgi:nucleoside 2-deoxyribosyltransferase